MELSLSKISEYGTSEKTENSRFQITLVDERDKNIHPIKRIRINRFFENEIDRNSFINMIETAIRKSDGKLVYDKKMSHFCFESFDVYDKYGNQDYSLTVYR